MEMSGETIGQRLRRLRKELGFSQRKLAELTRGGVTAAYISRIEKGERSPSVKTLRRLSSPLGVSAEFLETGEDASRVLEGYPLESLLQEIRRRLPEMRITIEGDG